MRTRVKPIELVSFFGGFGGGGETGFKRSSTLAKSAGRLSIASSQQSSSKSGQGSGRARMSFEWGRVTPKRANRQVRPKPKTSDRGPTRRDDDGSSCSGAA